MISITRFIYPCIIVILLCVYWYTYNYSVCVTGNLRKLHIPSPLISSDALLNYSKGGLFLQTLNYVKYKNRNSQVLQQESIANNLLAGFNPAGLTTLVFLHIQKSGGSYFLQKFYSLDVGEPCQVRHKRKLLKEFSWCPRPSGSPFNDTWIFSTKTFGWVCGLHPTYTELSSCVPPFMDAHFGQRNRRYLYITILRHPVARFASEYLHVKRGATWFYRHKCLKQRMSPELVPPCYDGYYEGKPWLDVTFEEFISCPYNQAINRETRMITDLTLVDCYKNVRNPPKSHDATMLASAKFNLQRNFAAFAVNEYLAESQILLEHQLGKKFRDPFMTKQSEDEKSGDLVAYIFRKKELYDKIVELNHLDMELYQYAIDLFASRLANLGIKLNRNKLQQEINKVELDEEALEEQL